VTDPDLSVLAGDIGGTKTVLGFFRFAGGCPVPVAVESYASRAAACLEDHVDRFLKSYPHEPASACFGIAGPVIRGTAGITNLPWVISEAGLKERFGFGKVNLINDLGATAYGVTVPGVSEFAVLNPGLPEQDGAIGIIAPGTGLGTALMAYWDGKPVPLPSEGGHVDFAARNLKELALLEDFLSRMPHVSLERLASGPGLFSIYNWLKEHYHRPEPAWLSERILTNDPSRVVSEAAIYDGEPLCVEALEMFVSILGSAAGNLALVGLTTGGIFLGGGICPKILPKLRDGLFMEAFCAKGRFRSLLSNIPVKIILNDQAALLGAARRAFEILSIGAEASVSIA